MAQTEDQTGTEKKVIEKAEKVDADFGNQRKTKFKKKATGKKQHAAIKNIIDLDAEKMASSLPSDDTVPMTGGKAPMIKEISEESPESVLEPSSEPVPEKSPESVLEQSSEPVHEKSLESVLEPSSEPMPEKLTQVQKKEEICKDEKELVTGSKIKGKRGKLPGGKNEKALLNEKRNNDDIEGIMRRFEGDKTRDIICLL